ncbi:hypothetical protein, partial [Lonsdalea quercina]
SVETLSASWGFLRWGEKEKKRPPRGQTVTPARRLFGQAGGHPGMSRPLTTAVAIRVHHPAYPLLLTVLSCLYFSVSPRIMG